jgi:CRP-like cAMP-binding protein
MPEKLSALRGVPFLAGLDEARLESLASRTTEHTFARGEPLCREGKACAGLWVVVEGSIRSVKSSAAGKCRTLETTGAGGTCSMASTLDESCCPTQTEAECVTRALFIPRSELMATLKASPEAGLALAQELGARVHRATCQLVSLCLKDVRARVASFLVDQALDHGEAAGDGTLSFRMPGSQEDVAHRLGTEREVFARALRGLKTEQLIEQVRGRVSIRDLDRLREIGESG